MKLLQRGVLKAPFVHHLKLPLKPSLKSPLNLLSKRETQEPKRKKNTHSKTDFELGFSLERIADVHCLHNLGVEKKERLVLGRLAGSKPVVRLPLPNDANSAAYGLA